jgi:hypothetical protein
MTWYIKHSAIKSPIESDTLESAAYKTKVKYFEKVLTAIGRLEQNNPHNKTNGGNAKYAKQRNAAIQKATTYTEGQLNLDNDTKINIVRTLRNCGIKQGDIEAIAKWIDQTDAYNMVNMAIDWLKDHYNIRV